MLTNIDLSEITLENIGSWPPVVKIGAYIATFLFIAGLWYWFDISDQFKTLFHVRQQEIELRQAFEEKQRKAASLDAYRVQLREMRKTFGVLLHRLPSKTEVPGLLEDISKTGIASGLEFKLFDPLQEVRYDFYAELPIKIVIIGDYHQFGEFVSRVANLSRIVTLHDFTITHYKPQQSKAKKRIRRQDLLKMELTAKTYRYIDNQEQDKRSGKIF